MNTNIEEFKTQNTKFSRQFNAHISIISRYDEVISGKASKHALYESESKTAATYKPIITDINARIKSNLEKIEEQKLHFEEYKEILSTEIYSAVKKAAIREMKTYQQEQLKLQPKIMGLEKLLNESESGLIRILSSKADVDETVRLNEVKSNKVDTENMIDLIVE